MKPILHATSFSPASAAALETAGWLAWERGCPLVILHVAPGRDDDTPSALPPHEFESLWKQLEDWRPGRPVAVEHRLEQGDAARLIAATAQRIDASLIVLGQRERQGWRHWLFGNLADRVLHHAPCAVLLARDHSGAAARPAQLLQPATA
jgi:nucleotide-binding universal stress UspA family protein